MRFAISAVAALALSACATAAPPVQNSVSVPLDLSTGRPMATVSLAGGRTGSFVIDSGAQSAVVSQTTADTLKLQVIGEALMGSPAGGEPVKVFVVELAELSLAGVPALKRDAVVAADKVLPPDTGMGVLAPTQWADRVVTIDLAANTISLADAPDHKVGTWYPLSFRNMTDADVEIAGSPVQVHVDTGNPRGVVLPMRYADQLGVKDKLVPAPAIKMVDAEMAAFTAPVDLEISLGGAAIRAAEVTFSDVPFANIGASALKGHIVVLDNPNRRWGLAQTR